MTWNLSSVSHDVIHQNQDMQVVPHVPHVHFWNISGHIHSAYMIISMSSTSSCSQWILYSYLRRDWTYLSWITILICTIQAWNTCNSPESWPNPRSNEIIGQGISQITYQEHFTNLLVWSFINNNQTQSRSENANFSSFTFLPPSLSQTSYHNLESAVNISLIKTFTIFTFFIMLISYLLYT